MKIYTKGGDKGQTSLLSGKRVPKHHQRIEAYGTIDELNSHSGLLRDSAQNTVVTKQILEIQNILFTIGSHLAAEPGERSFPLPDIKTSSIEKLEKWMDKMDEELPEMRNFVLPGGHEAVSQCHICRCVCRRAERRVVELNENSPVDEVIIQLLNRLSDYFFVLSRWLTKQLDIQEVPWKSNV